MTKTLRLTVGLVAVATTMLSAQQTETPVTPAFEAVVLKRNTSGNQSMSAGSQPGGLQRVVNGPIATIFGNAYRSESGEVRGAPDWFNTERYDLTARIVGKPTPEQSRALWQALFAERMQLKAHLETEERPIYHLVVARSDGRLGPNIKPGPTDCAARRAAFDRGDQLPPPPLASNGMTACSTRMSGGMITTGGQTMERVASSVSGVAGRMVVDRTGLKGDYEFTLEYSTARPGAPATDDKPNIFTALQEQLGLKLEPARGPVEFVVIDHIERPVTD